MTINSAPSSTPKPVKGEVNAKVDSTNQRSVFLTFVLNMSWQLAVAVLVPIIAGVVLDNKLHTTVYLFVGLGVAATCSALVMWKTLQAANRLPVPKLSAEQKRAVQKAYEEEDRDE